MGEILDVQNMTKIEAKRAAKGKEVQLADIAAKIAAVERDLLQDKIDEVSLLVSAFKKCQEPDGSFSIKYIRWKGSMKKHTERYFRPLLFVTSVISKERRLFPEFYTLFNKSPVRTHNLSGRLSNVCFCLFTEGHSC